MFPPTQGFPPPVPLVLPVQSFDVRLLYFHGESEKGSNERQPCEPSGYSWSTTVRCFCKRRQSYWSTNLESKLLEHCCRLAKRSSRFRSCTPTWYSWICSCRRWT